MDTDIAPASLASGRAVPIGAECGGGVHDAPPGSAWKHCHEEYVWTPVCFTTSPHHGLVLVITQNFAVWARSGRLQLRHTRCSSHARAFAIPASHRSSD